MSGTKYASLPDIDTAPDIYETPETSTHKPETEENSEDEALGVRPNRRNKEDLTSREDLDRSSLPNSSDVQSKFRKLERQRGRFRQLYSYGDSDDEEAGLAESTSGSRKKRPQDREARLLRLRAELEELEQELADPSQTNQSEEAAAVDAASLLTGLNEVRGRLDTLNTGSSSSSSAKTQRLLSQVTHPNAAASTSTAPAPTLLTNGNAEPHYHPVPSSSGDADTFALLDRRLGELEATIGASEAPLDETTPLPKPLLPHINRLSNVVTLLSQPRQIDAVSRRLKLLQTDLERYSAAQTKRNQNQANAQASAGASGSSSQPAASAATTGAPGAPLSSNDISLVLQRLAPALPTIPHLLTRLRTLSTLHASASGFASSLASLEEDQKKTRSGLTELEKALEALEGSFEANAGMVEGNLRGLMERLESVQAKVGGLTG